MANDFSVNPWILDTTGVVTALNDKPYKVQKVEWVNPVTAGDAVEIKDQYGQILIKATCVNANQNVVEYFNPAKRFVGLNIATLDSGTVLVYYIQA